MRAAPGRPGQAPPWCGHRRTERIRAQAADSRGWYHIHASTRGVDCRRKAIRRAQLHPCAYAGPKSSGPMMCGQLRRLALVALFVVLLPVGAHADKRIALIIGNSAYQKAPKLQNPSRDAGAMGALFRVMAFDVVEAQHRWSASRGGRPRRKPVP